MSIWSCEWLSFLFKIPGHFLVGTVTHTSCTMSKTYIFMCIHTYGASQVVQWQRVHLPRQEMQETLVPTLLGWEDPLEKETATHSSILALGSSMNSVAGYSPWGYKRVGHAWVSSHVHTHIFKMQKWIVTHNKCYSRVTLLYFKTFLKIQGPYLSHRLSVDQLHETGCMYIHCASNCQVYQLLSCDIYRWISLITH